MRAIVVLPTPRVPVNRKAWCTRPCVERVHERLHDVLLPDQFGEAIAAAISVPARGNSCDLVFAR